MKRIMLLMAMGVLLVAGCSSQSASSTPTAASASASASSATASAKAAVAPQPIEGCVPSCNQPGLVRPGSIPEGPYKAQWFFGGQMVVTPSAPWSIHEDSTGEFSLTLDATPQNSVLFWEDVYPIENGQRVAGVPLTAQGLLGWMQKSSRLNVSEPHPGTIGADIPATVVDVTIAKGVKNEDPTCPSAACVLWLSYPQWTASWGIAEPQVQRFYVADVSYGGQKHLFVAVIYPDTPGEMAAFQPQAEKLIATAQVPATPALR
jgi:hypothetical protein